MAGSCEGTIMPWGVAGAEVEAAGFVGPPNGALAAIFVGVGGGEGPARQTVKVHLHLARILKSEWAVLMSIARASLKAGHQGKTSSTMFAVAVSPCSCVSSSCLLATACSSPWP